MTRKNITDKEQGDLESAANDSAIRLHHFDGKEEQEGEQKFIKAYDNQPQGNPGGSSNDSSVQPGNVVGSHNDNPNVFLEPGKPNNRQSLIPVIPSSTATATAAMKVNSAAVASGGSGYAVDDAIDLAGGSFSLNGNLNCSEIGTVVGQDETDYNGVGVNGTSVGGTLGSPGDVITMSDGSTIQVDVIAEGVSQFTVLTGSTSGNASNNPTITQVSSTGATTGFSMTLGNANQRIVTATINTVGDYSVLPSNPVSQSATDGSGTGATFTVQWGVLSVAVVDGGSGYLSPPVIQFADAGAGEEASAEAVLTGDVVTSVTVDGAGSGYVATAIVTIDAP